jgi:hypothetical protein
MKTNGMNTLRSLKRMKISEVWFVKFPLEESNEYVKRPAIVLDIDELLVLSVKVTKHEPRQCDAYDLPILYWHEAHLRMASTARISKAITIRKNDFIHKIGDLHPDDFDKVKTLYVKYLEEAK